MNEIQHIAERDQMDAALSDASRAVGRHFATLTEAGMPARYAIALCRQMQEQYLSSILPLSAFAEKWIHENEGLE